MFVRQCFQAGAGHIGEYDNCSFNVEGTGTFRGGAEPIRRLESLVKTTASPKRGLSSSIPHTGNQRF